MAAKTNMTATGLFWSRKGEVACGDHAPEASSSRWTAEGWRSILPEEVGRMTYRCQHCEGTPHGRSRPAKPAAPLVLNVDDRPATLYWRDRILRQHGFIVANADSGHKALDIARQIKPQLILMDVHLGDADGRELCQRIKQDPEFTGIPIVLISATLSGHTSQLETIRWASADGFIREPVEPTSLASTLWKVLGAVA
jgi:CheY-like chemotaxis protein